MLLCLTSPIAVQMIKKLCMNGNNKMYDRYDSYKYKQIETAFNIYNNVNRKSLDHLLIKCCIKSKTC